MLSKRRPERPERGEVDAAEFVASERLAWTEKQFQAALLEAYCGTKKAPLPGGWKPFHTFFSKNSMEGWPDLVLLRAGRIVIAELKSETGKLSAAQEECLALLCLCETAIGSPAFRVFEWRPRHWNSGEIEQVLG